MAAVWGAVAISFIVQQSLSTACIYAIVIVASGWAPALLPYVTQTRPVVIAVVRYKAVMPTEALSLQDCEYSG